MSIARIDGIIRLDAVTHLDEQNKRMQEMLESGNDIHSSANKAIKEIDLGLLFEVAKKSNTDDFNKVLERIVKIKGTKNLSAILNSFDESGDTLIHVAASYGNGDTVSLIGERLPSLLTKKNSKGDTVWHIAAKTGNLRAFGRLLTLRGFFISQLSCYNTTSRTVTWEDLSLRQTNKEDNTVLHEALINRRKEMADDLFKQDQHPSYFVNKENKSAFYLAAEAGYKDLLDKMFQFANNNGGVYGRLKGKSPVHAAMMGTRTDVLELLVKKEPRFIQFKDEEGRNPLHWAASIGFLEGTRYLSGKYSFLANQKDENGSFPIHCASSSGHVDVFKELTLSHWYYNKNMLNRYGQNVLHVAAKNGRHNVVSYILKIPEFENTLNQIDKDGNTALHLATLHWSPKIVSSLTWHKKVDLQIKNKEGLTALDVAEYNMEGISSFQQWLTWQALIAAGAPRGGKEASVRAVKPSAGTKHNKNTTKALIILSILMGMISYICFVQHNGHV